MEREGNTILSRSIYPEEGEINERGEAEPRGPGREPQNQRRGEEGWSQRAAGIVKTNQISLQEEDSLKSKMSSSAEAIQYERQSGNQRSLG